jgi:hypothetical protein
MGKQGFLKLNFKEGLFKAKIIEFKFQICQKGFLKETKVEKEWAKDCRGIYETKKSQGHDQETEMEKARTIE